MRSGILASREGVLAALAATATAAQKTEWLMGPRHPLTLDSRARLELLRQLAALATPPARLPSP